MNKLIAILLLILSSYAFSTDIIVSDLSSTNKIIEANGKNGRHGSDGSSGRDQSCDADGNTIWATDGSDGGDGADGENGSNVLFIYDHLEDLKNFTVLSRGGRGGRGGSGGQGGSGGGTSGDSGSRGKDGVNGHVYLLHSSSNYIKDQVKFKLSIKELLNENFIRKNVWTSKTGAMELVAKDSIVSDEYFIFDKLIEKKIVLIWDSKIDINSKFESIVEFTFENLETKINFKKSFVDYELVETEDQLTITVKDMISFDSYFDFTNVRISGKRESLKLSFTNLNTALDYDNLKVGLELAKPIFFSYSSLKGIFDQADIKEYVSFKGQDISVDIGQTSVKRRFIKRGKKLTVLLRMTVSKYGKTARFTMKFNHRVGSNKVKHYDTWVNVK